MGVETIDYTKTDVTAELKERSGGRGPDVCIEAVGMEAHSTGPDFLYDVSGARSRPWPLICGFRLRVRTR